MKIYFAPAATYDWIHLTIYLTDLIVMNVVNYHCIDALDVKIKQHYISYTVCIVILITLFRQTITEIPEESLWMWWQIAIAIAGGSFNNNNTQTSVIGHVKSYSHAFPLHCTIFVLTSCIICRVLSMTQCSTYAVLKSK